MPSQIIRETTSLTFQGVTFDNNLKWHEHMDYIKNK